MKAMQCSGFAPLILIDRFIEKGTLGKAFRIHSSEGDRRGLSNRGTVTNLNWMTSNKTE